MKKLFKLGLVLFVLLGFVAPQASAEDFSGEKVSVGVASEYEESVWKVVQELAAEEGIEVEIVLFTDYIQPNIALNEGSLDLNAFQHIAYLTEWNEANDGKIIPLGFTYVAPLRAYSDKHEEITDLPDGAVVAIPNDPTNGGRALLALQQAGLIKVDEAAGILPTVNDITDNPKNLEFEELEAPQLPVVIPDVDVAFITNNFALDAGLSVEDAIYSDGDDLESLSHEYKNTIAALEAKPLYKRIVELYHTKEVEDKLAEVSEGADLPAWTEGDAFPLELN